MVGVTGFEPALPTAVAWSNRAQSTALLPFLPALGGETSIKQPTGLFYLCFPLIPNRWFGTIKEAAGANLTAAIKKEKAASFRKHPSLCGRSDWIRTSGLLVPNGNGGRLGGVDGGFMGLWSVKIKGRFVVLYPI